MVARVTFAAENAPLIKVLGQPQSFRTDSPQSRGKTANESLCEELETWLVRRGWDWCLRICLEKQHVASKEISKNVTLGYKKTKWNENGDMKWTVWIILFEPFYRQQPNFVVPSYILRMWWQLCTAVGPAVSLKDIFQKVEGKKQQLLCLQQYEAAEESHLRLSSAYEPYTVPYLLTLTAFEKGICCRLQHPVKHVW